jgi:hypothetical protein
MHRNNQTSKREIETPRLQLQQFATRGTAVNKMVAPMLKAKRMLWFNGTKSLKRKR